MAAATSKASARWHKAQAARAIFTERFPLCFTKPSTSKPKRPLKLGILADLIQACPDVKAYDLKLGLEDYTNGPKYARVMVAGAERIGLDGQPAGVVTSEEAELGVLRSMARQQFITLTDQIRDLQLFCCHVRKSDEQIACSDYASALALADTLNKQDATLAAVPAPWRGSYDEHRLAMHCAPAQSESVAA